VREVVSIISDMAAETMNDERPIMEMILSNGKRRKWESSRKES
jgi:hypothetical protein